MDRFTTSDINLASYLTVYGRTPEIALKDNHPLFSFWPDSRIQIDAQEFSRGRAVAPAKRLFQIRTDFKVKVIELRSEQARQQPVTPGT